LIINKVVDNLRTMSAASASTALIDPLADPDEERLDRVFFALSDPVRRKILERLDQAPLLVSELAEPFAISLQAVSRHIQVLVRAGLVRQERSGRISRCSLDAGPVFAASVWINRYSKYWQGQFDVLAAALEEIEDRRTVQPKPKPKSNPKPGKAKRRRSTASSGGKS
jgi:DNA-binding transcriptional ArsR family regulator